MHPILTTTQLTTLHLIADGQGFHGNVARQRAAAPLRHRAAAELVQQGLVARGPSASGYVLLNAGTEAFMRYQHAGSVTESRHRYRWLGEPTGDPHIVSATAVEFYDAIESAMGQNNPHSAFVTHYSLTDLRAMRARYLALDGLAGIAAHDYGDGRVEGTALFNASDKKGIGRVLLRHAVKYAVVNYLECLGDVLRKLYESEGFHVEQTFSFDPNMAPPGWDETRFGRPNYYTLTRSPMEFTGSPPKTMKELEARQAEMDAADPKEIRSALIRALKQDRPGITQSEIDTEMAIAEAAFGVNF